MTTEQALVKITSWQGSQHPTLSNVTRLMHQQGLRPYKWQAAPNQRHPIRSHGYTKILYVIDGTVEITLPDNNQSIKLRAGERIDIPAKIRHSSVIGANGALCLEAAIG
ncbi:MAG: cupin domain-containing protein [Phototrophicaceae bacterium]|jgi:quercetin dioxygenase-like cupin family protein